jgi:serine/threonine-protein kinase HipA
VPALVIERYDRDAFAPDGRIHQEDFNQVLGCSGSQKYQRYGGKASLRRIAGVLSGLGDLDSLERLYKLVVLAVAIGNLDLHAKNLSLLHPPDAEPVLAPAYDVVPMAHLLNDGEMALAIDGEYRHASITIDPLIREGTSWQLANAEALARETLLEVMEVVRDEVPHADAYPSLAADISRFSRNLLEGRPAREMSSQFAVELPNEPRPLGH